MKIYSKKIKLADSIRRLLSLPAAHRIERNFRYFSKRGDRQLAVFSHDLIGSRVNAYGIYEEEELDLLTTWLVSKNYDPNKICVDIGANIGNHSVYFSRFFKKVVAFEPNPRVYRLLSINSELSSNIDCHMLALSDKNGQSLMSFESINLGGASIKQHNSEGTVVETKKLDDIFFDHPIGLMKIDVEGHEEKVLRGAANLIEQFKPLILFEQHIEDFTDGKSPSIEFLRELGYSKFAIAEFSPKVSRSLIKNLLINFLRIFTFGASSRLVIPASIKPDFYPFIIAIPE